MTTLKVSRRGIDRDDDRYFSDESVVRLQEAQVEIEWLLQRGYNINSSVNFVTSHYQFSARQKNALKRSTSSESQCAGRNSRLLSDSDLEGKSINIDGFNLIITLEVALSGGVLILGNDGVFRDIAGLRGTYSLIDKTDKALVLIGMMLQELKISRANFFLDAPVSNSGRLKSRILLHASDWNFETEVELVKNADIVLCEMERVATGDSIILDNCISWFNLSRKIIETYLKNTRIVKLYK